MVHASGKISSSKLTCGKKRLPIALRSIYARAWVRFTTGITTGNECPGCRAVQCSDTTVKCGQYGGSGGETTGEECCIGDSCGPGERCGVFHCCGTHRDLKLVEIFYYGLFPVYIDSLGIY